MRTTLLLLFSLSLLVLARPDAADAQDRRRAAQWPVASNLCFEHLRVGDVDRVARSLVPEGVVVHTDIRTNCLVLVGIDDTTAMSRVLTQLEARARTRPRNPQRPPAPPPNRPPTTRRR